jgi:hypothetical protein
VFRIINPILSHNERAALSLSVSFVMAMSVINQHKMTKSSISMIASVRSTASVETVGFAWRAHSVACSLP